MFCVTLLEFSGLLAIEGHVIGTGQHPLAIIYRLGPIGTSQIKIKLLVLTSYNSYSRVSGTLDCGALNRTHRGHVSAAVHWALPFRSGY